MKVLIALVLFIALVAVWVVWGRPWLKTNGGPRSQAFFAWIEPIEIRLWSKSRTIFKARALMLIGLLMTVLTQAGAVDITPLMPLVPDAWEGIVTIIWNMIPLTLTALGAIDEKLRKDTTLPIEIVAVAEKDMTPKVAEAIAVAQAAKVEAVAVVKAEEVKTEAAAVAPTKGAE